MWSTSNLYAETMNPCLSAPVTTCDSQINSEFKIQGISLAIAMSLQAELPSVALLSISLSAPLSLYLSVSPPLSLLLQQLIA